MSKVALFTFTSIIALVFLPVLTIAQSNLSIPGQITDIEEQISSTVEPSIPAPGESVTITLEAYGTDLNRANITWTHNGKEALKGTGAKVFNFTANTLGKTDIVRYTVLPVNGPAIVKTITLSPSEVDLLWEANTYTPPFYKGKALFTPQADVTFVAIPNMVSGNGRVSSKQVIYKWKIDSRVEGDKGGFGRDTFQYTGPIILREHVFEVEAYASNNPNMIAKSKTLLEAFDPRVNIYEDHPLYGLLFNRDLLGSFRMDDSEKKIAAYPFFFSTSNKNSNVTYQWNVNDSTVKVPLVQNTMVFRKTEASSGTARVNIRVNSTKKLLQESFGYVSLFFGEDSSIFLR